MAACLLALALHELSNDEIQLWLPELNCRFWVAVSGARHFRFVEEATAYMERRNEESQLYEDVD